MIGTSFPMVIAIFSRILQHSFWTKIEPYDFFIPLYVSLVISAFFLVNDILKKIDTIPFTIITAVVLLNVINFHVRYTEMWLEFVRYVGNTFF